MNARITVFTFKQGLLSRVAHDLKIAVDDVELDEQLNATIDPRSLRVVCAMKKGRVIVTLRETPAMARVRCARKSSTDA